jgi:ribonuclease HII
LEREARRAGYALVAGVDEAGRGSLAGPVVAAAVIFEREIRIPGLDDSKKLAPSSRAALASEIRERALAWSVAAASVQEIDRINILHAARAAMRRAVEGLSVVPSLVLVDGGSGLNLPMAQRVIVDGDAHVACIAAASILAKVERDRIMTALDGLYPGYGFASHKGYACAEHFAAIRRLGPSPEHRRSFSPFRTDPLFG